MLKKRRVVNKKFLKHIKTQPCLICKFPPPSDPCHISSVGSRGDDTENNVIPMCRRHHNEQHSKGILSFYLKYKAFRDFIDKHKREDFIARVHDKSENRDQ